MVKPKTETKAAPKAVQAVKTAAPKIAVVDVKKPEAPKAHPASAVKKEAARVDNVMAQKKVAVKVKRDDVKTVAKVATQVAPAAPAPRTAVKSASST